MHGQTPAAREDHTWTVAEDGRTAHLFGGRAAATVFDDLWTFDLATDRWQRQQQAGPKPPARFGHEAAWLPGRGLLVWAGQAGDAFFDDVWLLDPERGAWQRLEADGEIPLARYGSCSGIGPDGRFWISHGFTANGVRFDDTKTFDLDELAWMDRTPGGPAPIERCLHACWWTSDGRLALYGGQTNGVPALGDLWFLGRSGEGEARRWTEAAGQQAPARQLAAVAHRDGITVIVGGRGKDGEVLDDTWILEDSGEVLLELQAPRPPAGRSGSALIYDAAADRYVLFGGVDEDAFDDAWALTLS